MEYLDETASIISAAKVTGTSVYNTDGDLLGEIHDVMLDKGSGKIAYAVMSFGGFLWHRRTLPPAAVGDPQIRHAPGRVRGGHPR